MDNEKTKRFGIIGVASRRAGVFVGTVAVVGNKVAGAGLKRVAAVRDLLSRSVKQTTSATKGQTGSASALKPKAKETVPLEKDLVELQRELDETKGRAEKAQSELASQLRVLQAEKQSLASQLEHARHEANDAGTKVDTAEAQVAALESELAAARHEQHKVGGGQQEAKSGLHSDTGAVTTETELSDRGQKKVATAPAGEKVESLMETHAVLLGEEEKVGVEEWESWKRLLLDRIWPLIAEAEAPTPREVTVEDVQAATFANAAEKIVFTRAISDLASQDTAARADAAGAIGGISHDLSVRALIAQMAREPSARVRQECIKALTTLGRKETLPTVVRALTDRAASVRLTAVWGLYRLAGPESAPVLTHMFSDKDEEVRRRAVICIGWLGQKELARELLPLLTDSSAPVRQAAAEVMGKLRSRQVVWTLIEHLNDPDKLVRKAIIGAIEAITGKKMNEPFPTNEKALQRLIARWREWCKEELQG